MTTLLATVTLATFFLVSGALIVVALLQNTLGKLRTDVARTAINVDIMATRLIALRSDMQLVERKLADICGPRQPGE